MMRILFFLYALSISTLSIGQDTWSLKQCVEYGIENNLDIEGAQLSQEEAALNESLARQAQYPFISGGFNAGSNFGRTIDPVSNQFVTNTFITNGVSLSGGVVLYNAGRLRNAIKQAKIFQKQSANDAQQLRNDIALKIAQDYLNAVLAKENMDIIQLQKQILSTQYSNIERMVNIGNKARAELVEMESQLALAEQNEIIASNSYETAIHVLKQDMRYPMGKELVIESQNSTDILVDPDATDPDALYAYVLENHYRILSGKEAVAASDLGIAMAKSSLLPRVSLSGSLGTNYSNKSVKQVGSTPFLAEQDAFINGNPVKLGIQQAIPKVENKAYLEQYKDNLSYGLGLQVSVPIYSNGQNRASIQRAKLNKKRASLNLQKIEDNLYMTIQRAVRDARAAKRKYTAAQKRTTSSKLVYDNAKKRYDIGNVEAYRYLDAQNRYQQSQLSETIAKYEYIFACKVLDFYAGKAIF